MPAFKIVETTVSDKAAELFPLMQFHHDEIDSDKPEVSPNWDAYKTLEQSGALLALVAYLDDAIVGYSVSFVGPHMHYSGMRYAHNDALFVMPAHRGSLGVRIIKETEEKARAMGASMMLWGTRPGSSLNKLLPCLGYGVREVMFSKELN